MTDWNQFRGDRQNSGSRPELTGPPRPEEAWSLAFDDGVSSPPVVCAGTVYLGADGRLFALEGRTGRREWVSERLGAITAAPVATRDRVYLSTGATVVALEAATGEVVWTDESVDELESGVSAARSSSPLALADEALVVAGRSGLTALEVATGHRRWHHETDAPTAGHPALADGRVYAGTDDGTVHALEVETGDAVWDAPTDGVVVGGPTVVDDRVYTADDSGTLLALDAETGQSWFAYQIRGSFASGVTVVDDAAFVAGSDNTLHVVDTTFGKRKLRGLLFSKDGVSLDGDVRGEPVAIGDVLCLSDSRGTLYGIGLAEDDFADFRWHYRDDPLTHAPAVAPESLYVVFDGTRVACLEWDETAQ